MVQRKVSPPDISQRDPRRSMFQSPFGSLPQQPYTMPAMTMTMSDMDSTLARGYQQQQSSVGESTPVAYWRPTIMDPQPYKPVTHNGNGTLDLEFPDFLTPRDTTGSNQSSTASSSNASVHGLTHGNASAGSEMAMADGTYGATPSSSSSSSVMPLFMPQAQPLTRAHTNVDMPSNVISPSTLTTTTSNSPAVSAARPAMPVSAVTTEAPTNNATSSPSPPTPSEHDGSYSRFVDTTNEPDLTQRKIEQKNEKCQYHNCPNRARVLQLYGKFCNRHVIVAPCGFPGCRDKAVTNSSMCDRHLAEGKDALHRILASRAQNVPVCRTFGCFKNDQGRGYCRGHEKLLMATGRLPKHINKRRLNSAYTMCSYPNCNKHSQRNHLCRTHGNVILKQAEELSKQSGESFDDVLARLQKEIRRCSHPTCTKNSQRDRLCTMHYYEKHNIQQNNGTLLQGKDGMMEHVIEQSEDDEDEGGVSMDTEIHCHVSGCDAPPYASGMCKYHAGGASSMNGVTDQDGDENESCMQTPSQHQQSRTTHPMCSVLGCSNIAPYASGLCAHHGNKTNQAIQITRTNSTSASMSVACNVVSCSAHATPGSNMCASHQQVFGGNDLTPVRPSLDANGYYAATNSGPYSIGDVNNGLQMQTAGLERYGGVSGGATRRMAGLSVAGSSAENDARQALCDLNNTNSGDSSTCSNPMCSRESFGQDYCESCQNMFSPLVVSVGEVGSTGNSYGYQASGAEAEEQDNQLMQPEPESESASQPMGAWDDTSKSTSINKSRDLCRAQGCHVVVVRGGLCDDHVRAFQSGSLTVDQITLHSRQGVEDHTRLSGMPDEMIASPRKKYFCKVGGCDKQARKRGLCKRHFRLQDGDNTTGYAHSSTDDNQFQDDDNDHAQGCQFPNCAELVNASTTLCPSHSKATYCWHARCENVVDSPQFCEYHAVRGECAVDGCTFAANRTTGSCSNHTLHRRCSHEHCEKFAVSNDRCHLHFEDCMHRSQACGLCELHGARRMTMMYNGEHNSMEVHGKAHSEHFHAGTNGFEDESSLPRAW